MVLLLLLLLSHFSLCDPIDSSPPGSPIPGILQASGFGLARVLCTASQEPWCRALTDVPVIVLVLEELGVEHWRKARSEEPKYRESGPWHVRPRTRARSSLEHIELEDQSVLRKKWPLV